MRNSIEQSLAPIFVIISKDNLRNLINQIEAILISHLICKPVCFEGSYNTSTGIDICRHETDVAVTVAVIEIGNILKSVFEYLGTFSNS